MDYNAAMEQKYDDGVEKGINLGIKKGKVEVAVTMLSKGLDIKLVAELTKLNIEEIKQH